MKRELECSWNNTCWLFPLPAKHAQGQCRWEDVSGLLLEPGGVPKPHKGLRRFGETGAGWLEDSISGPCWRHARAPDECLEGGLHVGGRLTWGPLAPSLMVEGHQPAGLMRCPSRSSAHRGNCSACWLVDPGTYQGNREEPNVLAVRRRLSPHREAWDPTTTIPPPTPSNTSHMPVHPSSWVLLLDLVASPFKALKPKKGDWSSFSELDALCKRLRPFTLMLKHRKEREHAHWTSAGAQLRRDSVYGGLFAHPLL